MKCQHWRSKIVYTSEWTIKYLFNRVRCGSIPDTRKYATVLYSVSEIAIKVAQKSALPVRNQENI